MSKNGWGKIFRGDSERHNKEYAENNEFADRIARLTKSGAYLDYCEEVYGYRMTLFNMMDREQLDYVFHKSKFRNPASYWIWAAAQEAFLKHLAREYGSSGVGIDRLGKAVLPRSRGLLRFVSGDIDRLADWKVEPTVVLSIDSLYFSKD